MQIDANFLAGFVAGEGHFWVAPKNAGQSWACGFQLCQREDNADLVAAACDLAGCGGFRWIPRRSTSHPQFYWLVSNMTECSKLADFLTGAPLLGKKAGDFAIWNRAVEVWTRPTLGPRRW